MILSGLVLWFPMKITHLLPGELIPVSKALHTNEAMLIFIVLALWHIYNAIFSPDVFPLDTSMFTGKISRERMVREHPLELARIEEVTLEEVLRSHFQERYPRNKNASSSEVKSHAPLK